MLRCQVQGLLRDIGDVESEIKGDFLRRTHGGGAGVAQCSDEERLLVKKVGKQQYCVRLDHHDLHRDKAVDT